MKSLKDILEILYFASGIAVAVIAGFGLQQIREIKRQTQTSETQHREVLDRDARRLAAELGERYIRDIAPRSVQHHGELENLRLNWSRVWSEGPLFDWSSIPLGDGDKQRFRDQLLPWANTCSDVLNELEGMALLFNRNVASDELGRSLLAAPIVSVVCALWPVIAVARIDSPKAYTEIASLYDRWNSWS